MILLTIEVRVPDEMLYSLEKCVLPPGDVDLMQSRVLLFSGDAASGKENFSLISGVRLGEFLFDAIRDRMPTEEMNGVKVFRFEFLIPDQLLSALGLSFDDLARRNLSGVNVSSLQVLEVEEESDIFYTAIKRVATDKAYFDIAIEAKRYAYP